MVRFSNIIMEGIRILLNNKTMAYSCNYMLEKILNDTYSQMGIIGNIKYDNNNIPTLYPLGITNIGWTHGLSSNIKNISFRFDHDSLLYAPIKHKKTIITNKPSIHQMSTGVPKGHPKITSFIGTPIYDNDKIIGYICLANKKAGYNESFISSFERLARMLSFVLLFYSETTINYSSDLIDNSMLLEVINKCRDSIIIVDKFKKIKIHNNQINDLFKIPSSINLHNMNIIELFPHLSTYFTNPVERQRVTKIIIIQINGNNIELKINIYKLK